MMWQGIDTLSPSSTALGTIGIRGERCIRLAEVGSPPHGPGFRTVPRGDHGQGSGRDHAVGIDDVRCSNDVRQFGFGGDFGHGGSVVT